jgi:Holliday junction resolvasome RuvABC DNA-binding subunit
MMKADHKGINIRPKPQTKWGSRLDRDWGIHVIQSFDGVGPGVAGAIFDRFGVPMRWTITRKDLESVPGVGPKRAAKMWETLNGD